MNYKIFLIVLICVFSFSSAQIKIESLNINNTSLIKNSENEINFQVLDINSNFTDPEEIFIIFSENITYRLYREKIGNYIIKFRIENLSSLNVSVKIVENGKEIIKNKDFEIKEEKREIDFSSKIEKIDRWIKQNTPLLVISSIMTFFGIWVISILLRIANKS